MRLQKVLLCGFIITFIGMQPLYAAECPRLTLNDFIKGTINVSVSPDLEIQHSIPAYFIKKSFLEQNQMEVPTQLDDYPILDVLTTDLHSDINLAEVEWNSETKQITCHYEIAEMNSSDFNAFDLTTVRKDIMDPAENVSSPGNQSSDKFVWRITHFSVDNKRYDGSSCNGYESPIPVSTCMWQDR